MMESIRVLINGAKGRMGLEAIQAVNAAEGMELVGETDLGDSLEQAIIESKADIVVDLTAPDCAYENAMIIGKSPAGGVIGTTGFKPHEINELKEYYDEKKPGILIAPNFSIGAVLLMHVSQTIGKYMPEVEIIEMHHPAKLDAPSGTAIKTAQLIAEARGEDVPRGTSTSPARGEYYEGIPVHSVRLPGLLAHQEVIFGGQGQTLTIRHDSLNRGCFMPGIILGIREMMNRSGLIYGLDQILI